MEQHALVLEEGFCDSLRSIAEEYKTRYGYGTLNEVYRLLGISRQQVTYWKANPCSTQTKKRYFTVLKAAELFCLSDEAAELLANKAGLSLQGEQEENTGVQKLFKQYTDKQKKTVYRGQCDGTYALLHKGGQKAVQGKSACPCHIHGNGNRGNSAGIEDSGVCVIQIPADRYDCFVFSGTSVRMEQKYFAGLAD